MPTGRGLTTAESWAVCPYAATPDLSLPTHPLAASLMVMNDAVKTKMKKFDICYLLATEGIAFKKYPAFFELEARHGVNLGFAYKTKNSAKTFVTYIASTQWKPSICAFSEVSLFKLLDGLVY